MDVPKKILMKTATTTFLRRSFSRVLAWIEDGHSVDVTKHGRIMARLVPPIAVPKKLVKPDIMARLKEVWGDRVLSVAEVKEMREAELEGEDG